MNNSEIVTLFSVPIRRLTFKEVTEHIRVAVIKKQKIIVFATNIHNTIQMSVNRRLFALADKADIIFADGMPLVWLSCMTKHPLPERVSGTAVVDQILKTEKSVFLLGSTPDVLSKMVSIYNNQKRLPIVGFHSPPYKSRWNTKDNLHILAKIKSSHAKIILVGVGHPKQEMWIVENAKKINASVFMAVGSAFDILSGKTPRAPKWMQSIGCEWIWRIYLEPRRLLFRYLFDCVLLMKLLTQSMFRSISHKQTPS